MTLLPNKLFTLQYWYPLNLLEEEGLGTTYECLAKMHYFKTWFSKSRNKTILVAGLPGKYGFSLDLILATYYLGATKINILDHRKNRLEKLKAIIANPTFPNDLKLKTNLYFTKQKNIQSPKYLNKFKTIDLICNSEVVQNWPSTKLKSWFTQLSAKQIISFIPNGDNQSHMTTSHLKSIKLNRLKSFITTIPASNLKIGYLDMPPFPPGIKRTSKQKKQLSDSKIILMSINYIFKLWLMVGELTILKPYLRKHAHLIFLTIHKH